MKNKYPPLPHPFYDRGEFGTIQADCYNEEQMRAYADAAREGQSSPEKVQTHADTIERYTLDEIATATRYADLSVYQYNRIRDELRMNRAIAATAGATHE